MPYLYRQAVIAHQQGIPMHRPMFIEYPDDRACDTLDKQFFLGDSLLIAPVFKESGEVDYYLPKGIWTNLLTGEKRKGGTWRKEKHNYFSLPLMVKENTILPVGNNAEEASYDFADGVTLYLSEFTEGAISTVEIPDQKGNTVMTASARREGNKITLTTEGGGKNWKAGLLGADSIIEGTGNQIIIEC